MVGSAPRLKDIKREQLRKDGTWRKVEHCKRARCFGGDIRTLIDGRLGATAERLCRSRALPPIDLLFSGRFIWGATLLIPHLLRDQRLANPAFGWARTIVSLADPARLFASLLIRLRCCGRAKPRGAIAARNCTTFDMCNSSPRRRSLAASPITVSKVPASWELAWYLRQQNKIGISC